MRIGILTLHSGTNYGGTLQCYSLYRTLLDRGFKVKIIDFVPARVAPLYKRIFFRLTSYSFKQLFNSIHSKRRTHVVRNSSTQLRRIFDKFRDDNLHLTERVDEYTISKLNSEFDVIIIGSDQVWSSYVREKLTYFGDWFPQYKGRLISYAACATNENYPMARKFKIRNLLKQFSAISVRDITSKNIIKKFIPHCQIDVVLDPTQMYDFPEVKNSISLISQPYILVYVLGSELSIGNKRIVDFIRNHGAYKNTKVIAVTIYDCDVQYADETLKTVKPLDWVKLIKHADVVLTDSFHASVFAMKFKTPCIGYYCEANRASRLIHLFQESNLSDFLISNETDLLDLELDFGEQYLNYKPIDRESSFSFLIHNIR